MTLGARRFAGGCSLHLAAALNGCLAFCFRKSNTSRCALTFTQIELMFISTSQKVAKELSDLVNYIEAVHFHGFEEEGKFYQV